MTTMFYNSLITIAKCYRSIVNTGTNLMSISYNNLIQQTVSEEKNYVQFCKYIETCEGKSYKHKEIYEKILQAFEGEFFVRNDYAKYEISYSFFIHRRYNNYLVKETCDKKLKELMKTDEYKDTILDFSFFSAYNMFVDISTQTMDTLNKICTLRLGSKDNDEFRQNLITEMPLFKKYVLSLNWRIKLIGDMYDYKLLHNFKSISVKKNYNANFHKMTVCYKYYDLFNEYEPNENLIIDLIKTIPNYYENKKITNTKKVFKYENTKNLTEFYISKKSEYNKKLEFTVNLALNAIAVERGKLTIINYFSQKDYYENEKSKEVDNHLNTHQTNFIKNLNCVKDFKEILPLKFDTLCMHTNYSILCTYMLSIEQEDNIKYLTTCVDEYANMLMDCIQDKYKTAIAKFFDDLIDNNKQTDKSAKLLYIKQMCLDTVEGINSNLKTTKEIKTDTNTEAEKLTINNVKQYYEKKYISLFDEITIDDKYYSGFKECIKKIQEETKAFLDKQIGMEAVIEDITKITSLKKQIDENKEKIIDDLDNNFAKQTDPILFYKSAQAENKSFKIVSAQNKQIKQDEKTYKTVYLNLFTYNDVVTSKKNSYIIDKNKYIITNIINDTIQMKTMIIKAENDAYEFTRAIEVYCGMKDKNYKNPREEKKLCLMIDRAQDNPTGCVVS